MWKIPTPNLNCIFEPLEVRILKQQLASISCKCNICMRQKSNDLKRNIEEKEIQTNSIERSVQAAFENRSYRDKINRIEDVYTDLLCPGCYLALNLRRNNALVVKDEESETDNKMLSSDKSCGRSLNFLDRTTSVTAYQMPNYSNMSLCELMSEYSNDESIDHKKRRCERVTFLDQREPVKPINCNNCICLDSYINAIRPPMFNYNI